MFTFYHTSRTVVQHLVGKDLRLSRIAKPLTERTQDALEANPRHSRSAWPNAPWSTDEASSSNVSYSTSTWSNSNIARPPKARIAWSGHPSA